MRIRRIFVGIAIAMLAPLIAPSAAAAAPSNRELELRDKCDSASFNAVFGPGFCTTNGGVELDEFLADLNDGGSSHWWIRQRETELQQGGSVSAKNVGGIVHTFTEVSAFGKGCIPQFNVAVPETRDNCDFARFGATVVPQGQTSAPEKPAVGVHKFQCLIHPWMRTTVTVKR